MSQGNPEFEACRFVAADEDESVNADFDFRELPPLEEFLTPGAANQNTISVYALAFAYARSEIEIDPQHFGYSAEIVSEEELDRRADRFKYHYLGRAKQLFAHAASYVG